MISSSYMLSVKLRFLLLCCGVSLATSDVDLPPRHRNILFHQRPSARQGQNDLGESPKCWGYEDNCDDRYEPKWPHSCETRKQWKFWEQGDFGWLRSRLNELRDMRICESENDGSSLNCTVWLQFCQGRNIYMDLRGSKSRAFHPTDLFSSGEIGGKCHVDKAKLEEQALPNLDSGLRSWFSELKEFSDIPELAHNDSHCDVIIDKPVVMVKLDQGENMYHHMCDFLNLYLSLHLNGSIDFNADYQVVHWDWSQRPYHDMFHESWEAFTSHPVVNIREWEGKRVCMKSVIFPFLSRMVFGLYYNLPLVEECQGSGMVKSFSQFFLHRMKIQQLLPNKEKIRVTFLTRRSYDRPFTHRMYRKVVNEDELIAILRGFEDFEVRVEEFKHDDMTFRDQLTVTSNTDILIGMHGAGLTHLLFLPDWAVAFEIYDCDAICFRDLARLRGTRHMTWRNKENMTRHDGDETHASNPRYWNYSFDPQEFRTLILQARTMLFAHEAFSRSAATGHKEL